MHLTGPVGRLETLRGKCDASFLRRDRAGHPVQALVEPIPRGRACRLDEPLAMPQVAQTKLLGNLSCCHGTRQVLLVGNDEQHCVTHLVVIQYLRELFARILGAVPVVAVNHEDQTLRILVVVPPQSADLVLAADIPHRFFFLFSML